MWKQYQKALSAKDNRERGNLFEEFLRNFFRTIDGFYVLPAPVKTSETDIDIVIANNSTHPFFSKMGPLITVQAKNYKKSIGWKVVMEAAEQAAAYGPSVKLVIVATTSKFSKRGKGSIRDIQTRYDITLVVLDKADWEEFFSSEMTPEEFLYNKILNAPHKLY